MSKEQIVTALGTNDQAQAEAPAAQQRERLEPARFIVNAEDIATADYGPATGYIRVLAAAVHRLSDEGVALAEENARLSARAEQLAAQLEALGVDVWTEEPAAPDAPPADGRGLEAIADPSAWGNAGAFDAFRAEAAERAAGYAQNLAALRERASAHVEVHRAEVERAEYQAVVARAPDSSPLMAEIRRQMSEAAERHVEAFLNAMLHGGQIVITFAPLRDGEEGVVAQHADTPGPTAAAADYYPAGWH